MTTELEEQFYKTFGIEPKKLFSARQGIDPDAVIYPEITDRVLLKLVCIAYSAHDIDLTIEEIKENILQNLIKSKDEVKHQIQQLFKEGK